MVPMRMPPGRSSTLANSARAARHAASVGSTCRRVSSSASFVRRHGHPAAERPLQAQRHLRGGGLGEGQALDALRRGAGQHQAQQPVGEQFGLARSGGGRDEGGYRRVGGGELFAVGALAGGFGGESLHWCPLPGWVGRALGRAGWVREMRRGWSMVRVFNTEEE